MRFWIIVSIIFCLASSLATAQVEEEPEGAHVDLYFPHLADGGPASAKWQTAITLLNPSVLSTATASLYFFGDDGTPLSLDFGSGPTNTVTVQIPASGSIILRSTAASSQTLTGAAVSVSTLPLVGTVQFRLIENGVPQSEVSALATSPGVSYLSPANYYTGIALANIYSSPLSLTVGLADSKGIAAGTTTVTVPATGHRSFNVFSLFPSLPSTFTGSVKISAAPNTYFVGWTLSADATGVFSSYPPGTQAWPVSHEDRIRDVYFKDLDAAQYLSNGLGLGLQFDQSTVPLHVLSDKILNAYASSTDNSVNIELALSELISDSPSELAFAVAHEMGHTIQFRLHKNLFVASNTEYDADQWGMIISLIAGYDPYAAAGTLAKLSMATDQAGLVAQVFDNINGDLHGSFNNRIDLVYQNIVAVCSAAGSFCPTYRLNFHPDFPTTTPLVISHKGDAP
ncbi:MAG TPA: hypothetical protein VHC90_15760 [Bryobacteraceae bacterium]|nr:hypothetical protein [Bryobacteraceae bacterium]